MSAFRFMAVLAMAATVLIAGLGGCGGGGGGSDGSTEQTSPPVGPIPAAEFAAVPPPTFKQAIAAFRAVTTANPALLNDEPALSRALFDEIRRATADASAGRTQASSARRQALFDLDMRMTLEEWKLVIRTPIQSARAAGTIEASAQAAIDAWPCDADVGFLDGKADALRHAYWNALMTRHTGAAFAELFATAHETGSANAPEASAMDLHNNALGRALAQSFPAAAEAQLLQMLLQQAYTFVPAGAVIPASAPGLVFIAERARRPFDGTYAGSMTAPELGAAGWSVEFHLAQCGAQVHGRYRASRGADVVERGYSGALAAGGTPTAAWTLALAMADAPQLSSGAGPNACVGMQAVLSGDERGLAGPWTSQTCPRGGIISLQR